MNLIEKQLLEKQLKFFLRKGEVKRATISKDKQEALELYRNEDDEYDLYKDTVLYPWQEELMKHMNPTDRQDIWIVGENKYNKVVYLRQLPQS